MNSCRHEDLNSRSNYDLFSELSVTSPGLYQRLELTSTFFFYHLTHNKGQIMTHESARKYSLSLFCLTTKRIIESQRSNLVEHLKKNTTESFIQKFIQMNSRGANEPFAVFCQVRHYVVVSVPQTSLILTHNIYLY